MPLNLPSTTTDALDSSQNRQTLVILEPESFSEVARMRLATRFNVQDYRGENSADAKVIIAGLRYQIDLELLTRFPSVNVVATVTTGLNHVDTALLVNRGISLVSLRDVREAIQTVGATAEMTIALILALGRRVVQSARGIEKEGAWNRMEFFTREISGQQLGIIGYGRIGSKVAKLAEGLGLTVVAFDPESTVPKPLRRETLAEILQESSIISLHADYRGSQILGKAEIDRCSHGAMIVNTARGELIDESAVAEAIRSGSLGGFAADVLVGENIDNWRVGEDKLAVLACQGHNVILTPHLGGCTREAFQRTQLAIADHLTGLEVRGL